MQESLNTHRFDFSKKENSGEGLSLTTEFFDNGDGVIFTNQRIKLQSYCNCASIDLFGIQITPELLRELANELDKAKIEAKNEIVKAV